MADIKSISSKGDKSVEKAIQEIVAEGEMSAIEELESHLTEETRLHKVYEDTAENLAEKVNDLESLLADKDRQIEELATHLGMVSGGGIMEYRDLLIKFKNERERSAKLVEALEFYAEGKHIEDFSNVLENPSGEPPNWLCDDDGKFNLENGGFARQAMAAYRASAQKGKKE